MCRIVSQRTIFVANHSARPCVAVIGVNNGKPLADLTLMMGRDVPVCDTSPAVKRRQTRADRTQKIGVKPNDDMAHIASKTSCRDVPVCDTSPAVKRRQTRADRAQYTPEITRCDDTDTVASFNMSSVSDLNADASPFISDALLMDHDVISGRSDTSLPPKCTYNDHLYMYDYNSTDIYDTIKPQTITSTEDSDERIDFDSRVVQDTLDAASPTSHSNVCATTEWEPPPGWCWACWMDINETGKCAKHA